MATNLVVRNVEEDAALALIHDLAVVTRNAGDFRGTGVELVNPSE